MRKLFFALSLISVFSLSAQTSRSMGPFNELVVSGKLDVLLVPGDTEEVIIYEEGHGEGQVNISIKGGTLKLNLLDGWLKGDRRIPVKVIYKDLRKIRVLAGAELQSDNPIVADQFEIKVGSGAEVELKLEVGSLEAGVTEGGVLELYGQVETQYVTASTGGEYSAEALNSENTHVKANTGGEARVVASKFINAVANTGGEIRYSGDPEEKYTKSNLAGDIRKY